jgi:hypothetical protein
MKFNGIGGDYALSEGLIQRFLQACSREKRKRATGCNNLEKLKKNNEWSTLQQLQKVIPYHLPHYTNIIKQCKTKTMFIKGADITFATKFMITYMFLIVKGTRPASYEHLTMGMLEEAFANEGIIDQTNFKTEDVYLFDCMTLSENDFEMLEQYTFHIRPLLKPKCDNVFINSRNGRPLQDVGKCMSQLIFEATGSKVTPTTYRKIIETESDDRLVETEKHAVSEDQKHASGTAKRYYRLTRARNAARKAKKCMSKLIGNSRCRVDSSISKHLSAMRCNTE